jgi:transaldolase
MNRGDRRGTFSLIINFARDGQLSPDLAAWSDIQKLDLDEKKFAWLFNQDAMATEKTAEGIRLFNADAMKLEKYIAERL